MRYYNRERDIEMNKTKKIISLILSTMLVISILPGAIASAMTPQEGANWALAQVGRWIDTDGAYGAQCVDLIVEYCKANFGWNPQGSGNAEAYRRVNLPNSSWQRIQNTPEFIPQPGDIAIWNPAESNGYCGHVAIIISADINSFVSVDQNLKGSANGSAAEKTTHNYKNFWGVIRPPFSSQPHSHSYTEYVYYWKAHPHYNCYRCSCGEVKERTNETNFIESCQECNNQSGSGSSGEQTVDDGLYTIKNASSGYMMNVYAGKDANGTKVTTWEYDGTTDQRIYIQHKGSGKYLLKFNASSSGRVIDVNRGASLTASIDDGDKIDIWTADDLEAQYFMINEVGNNMYTFELASKQGHVIAATNDSAAASNGTQLQLKSYTGASCQKWYLCDTSGNVIGACSHSRTTNKATNTSYSKKNESSHTVVTTYNKVCSDCGEVLKKGQTEQKTEAHSIKNNKCGKCGYAVVMEEPEVPEEEGQEEVIECNHNNTYRNRLNIESKYTPKDAEKHIVTEYYNISCTDCSSIVTEKIQEDSEENHVIENGVCVCGYTEPKRERTVNDGLYNIKNVASGYMMNVYGGKDVNGTKVTVWENDNSNDQKIYISYQGDGKYLLKYNASSNGRVIDVNRGNSMTASIDNGDKIDIWTSNDPEAQLFYINDCGNGEYSFELACKLGSVIAPSSAGAAKTNGAQLILDENKNADYQKWILTTTSNVRRTAYVYNTEGWKLNIRSSYISNSSVIGKIDEYSTITVVGEKINGFYPVEYNGKTGYAHSEYITFSVPERLEKINAWVYKTEGDNLNVRSSAEIVTWNVIGSFRQNAQITVLSRTVYNGFYKVKYGDTTGYASAAFITFNKPVEPNKNNQISSTTSSATATNNAINKAQSSAPKGSQRIYYMKNMKEANDNALNAAAQTAKLYHDIACDVNIRLAAEEALGTTLGAIATKDAKQIFKVFNTESGLGVMAMAANDEFYRRGKYYHQQYLNQVKNITTLQQAETAFKSFREAMAYYGAVQALNKDLIDDYAKKGHYTKRMLDAFFTSFADAALPTDDIKFLSNAATFVTTGGELLNLIMNNSYGADAVREIRAQWNNTWAKLN